MKWESCGAASPHPGSRFAPLRRVHGLRAAHFVVSPSARPVMRAREDRALASIMGGKLEFQ